MSYDIIYDRFAIQFPGHGTMPFLLIGCNNLYKARKGGSNGARVRSWAACLPDPRKNLKSIFAEHFSQMERFWLDPDSCMVKMNGRWGTQQSMMGLYKRMFRDAVTAADFFASGGHLVFKVHQEMPSPEFSKVIMNEYGSTVDKVIALQEKFCALCREGHTGYISLRHPEAGEYLVANKFLKIKTTDRLGEAIRLWKKQNQEGKPLHV